MRYLVFILFCFAAGCSSAPSYQVIVSDSYEPELVIDLPGLSRGVIYSRAKRWVAAAYGVPAGQIIDLDDDLGVITARYVDFSRSEADSMSPVFRHDYSVRIDTKDEKARITLFDFSGVAYILDPHIDLEYSLSRQHVEPMVASFSDFMGRGYLLDSDNW